MKAALKIISLVKHWLPDQNWEGADGKSTSMFVRPNAEFRLNLEGAEEEG